MTFREDLERLMKAEVEALRKKYIESDTKIKNLEARIKDKDIIIKLLKGKNLSLTKDAQDQINREISNHFAANQ
jgi:hypothetical protein